MKTIDPLAKGCSRFFLALSLLVTTTLIALAAPREPVEILVRGEDTLEILEEMQIELDCAQPKRTATSPASTPTSIYAYVGDEQRIALQTRGVTVLDRVEESAEMYAKVLRGWLERDAMTSKPQPELYRYDDWYSYEELASDLQAIVELHPDLAELVSAGPTVEGREVWFVKISDNVEQQENEPEFKYSSTMHGDEVTGMEMCRRLIHYLLDNYGTDPQVTQLVDEVEIWICPLHNADGYVAGSRYNHNGYDLNREFPFIAVDDNDPTGRPPEVQAMMAHSAAHSFDFGSNYHGGVFAIAIPYAGVPQCGEDCDALWNYGRNYTLINGRMYDEGLFDHGLTIGYQWSTIQGLQRDWAYYFEGDFHYTIEVSSRKWPPWVEMDSYWDENQDAMLYLMETTLLGARGVIREASTNEPLSAWTDVLGIDKRKRNDPDVGDYHRLLLPGTYTLEFGAYGYVTQQVADVVVDSVTATVLDIWLDPAPLWTLSGTTTNTESGLPMGSTVRVLRTDTGEEIAQTASNAETGFYELDIPPYEYEVRAHTPGFIPETTTLLFEGDTGVDFSLQSAEDAFVLVLDEGDAVTNSLGGALEAAGHIVYYEDPTTIEPWIWPGFRALVWSTEKNPSPLVRNSARESVEEFVANGGRLLIGGGEIAYDAAVTPGYPSFAANVLHISSWERNRGLDLVLHDSEHPMAQNPNLLPSTIGLAYNNYLAQDVVQAAPEATVLFGTELYPDFPGVLLYDDDGDPEHGQIVYFPFGFSRLIPGENPGLLLENAIEYLRVDDAASVDGTWNDEANRVWLSNPAPNPWRIGRADFDAVVLDLGLPDARIVEASVVDVAGRRVRSLLHGSQALDPGLHQLRWDGRTATGEWAPAGLYWLHVTAGSDSRSRRLVITR